MRHGAFRAEPHRQGRIQLLWLVVPATIVLLMTSLIARPLPGSWFFRTVAFLILHAQHSRRGCRLAMDLPAGVWTAPPDLIFIPGMIGGALQG